jgi:hypothetical protein
MRSVTLVGGAAALALLVLLAARALPQDGSPTPEEVEAMNRRWEAAALLGERHAALERLVGEWDVDVWVALGGAEVESKGKATYRWLIEGRWLAQELECAVAGRPIEGFGVTGYDNFKGKYVSTWVDDQSTAMLRFEGQMNAIGDVLRTYGVMDEPLTGEHDRPVMRVTRMVEAGHTVEVHDLTRASGATLVLKISYAKPVDPDETGKK